MSRYLLQDKGFFLAMEAIVALSMLAVMLFSLNVVQHTSLANIVVLKQASDIAEIALREGSIEDCTRLKQLSDALEINVKVVIEDKVVCGSAIDNAVVVQRTLVSNNTEFKTVLVYAARS